MKLYSALEAVRVRSKATANPSLIANIDLYAIGAEAKARQSVFALDCIARELDDEVQTTGGIPLLEKLEFFNDSFWVSIYASLDVSAQILNHAYGLGESERSVSFKGIVPRIQSNTSASAELKAACDALKASAEFRKLDDYRNCSAHRRPIALSLRRTVQAVETTRCYITTTDGVVAMGTPEATICDNPMEVIPLFRKRRDLTSFLAGVQLAVFRKLTNIIKEIRFVP